MVRGLFKRNKGAATSEAAVSLPLLLILMFLTVDLMRLGHAAVSLQYAVTRGLRQGSLASSSMATMDVGGRLNTVRSQISAYATSLGLNSDSLNISVCSHDGTGDMLHDCDPSGQSAGGPSSLVTASAATHVGSILVPGWNIPINATAIVQNEP